MTVLVGPVSATGSVAPDGGGLGAAMAFGLAALLAYIGLLGWLHVRRRRRLRTERNAPSAISEAAHAGGGTAPPRAGDATPASVLSEGPACPPHAAVPYTPPDL